MKNWRSRLDLIANFALIICCVLFIGFLIRAYFSTSRKAIDSNPQRDSLVGKRLAASQIDWSKNQQTLLLVLQKDCHFCDESAPFYQRLVKEISNQTKTHLVAAFPGNDAESKQYLKEKMIEITDVRRGSPNSLGVRGTPALLLIDNAGTVIEQWNGKLPGATEDAVISRLKQ